MTQTKAKHLKDSMCGEFAHIFELCQFVMVSIQLCFHTVNVSFCNNKTHSMAFCRTTWLQKLQKEEPFWILVKQQMMGWLAWCCWLIGLASSLFYKLCLQCIQSAAGENLTEAAQIANRWKEYCEDLDHDDEGNGTEQEYWEKEPPPLRSASRKATGHDVVPVELFKAGETALDGIHRMCVAIWKTGECPE